MDEHHDPLHHEWPWHVFAAFLPAHHERPYGSGLRLATFERREDADAYVTRLRGLAVVREKPGHAATA